MKPRDLKGFLDLTYCKPGRHEDKRKKQKHKDRDIDSHDVRSYRHRKKEEYERSYEDS